MRTDIAELRRVVHQGAIDALAMAHNYQDAYTGRHQRDTNALARAIGEELGLDSERVEGLALAASVHDLGKLAVPMEIINHPGPLTRAQFAVVQVHPVIGHNIMDNISMPWPISRIVLEHHERLDGTGYPEGLRGESILLESRIVAVADVLDALTTARPYREVISLDRALELLTAGCGTSFDPDVVEACVRVTGRLPLPAWKEPPSEPPRGDR